MSSGKWSSASLRISSAVTSGAEIAKILDIEPTTLHEKGTHMSRRNPKSQIMQESVWILESGLDSSQSLTVHIEALIAIISKKITLLQQLVPTCSIEIFCGFSSESGQGGFNLEAKLLAKLTVVPVNLVVDLYR